MPDNMRKLCRSFIAIPLPSLLKKRLTELQQRLAGQLPAMRWSAVDNLHLTLVFLGDQSEETLEQIAVSMLSVGRLRAGFRVGCRGLGSFPARHRARVLWLGLEPTSPLVKLQQQLSTELVRCGIPKEQRPFNPHLTLGRVRDHPLDLTKFLDETAEVDCGNMDVSNMILYESRLGPGGALHLPRQKVDLMNCDIF